KRLHIPIVSHSHTLPELFAPGAPQFIQKLIKKIVASMYRQYDGLIFPTQFLQKKFDDGNFTMQQAIIGNGVDTTIFRPAPQKDKKIFNLVYVGRLDPAKNIPLLLDALHLLRMQKKLKKNLRCTIVG
ncbi:MAG: glycosyltransferase, partial [bacterium]